VGGLDIKRKRYTEEQIIGILKEHEAGMSAQDLIRKHGIANGTFYRWKAKYGGMKVSEAKRLRELELENSRLKKLLAETLLDKTAGRRTVKKVVRPAQRRTVVRYLQSVYALSQHRACRLAGLSRKAAAYQAQQPDDEPLRKRLKELGEQYPRYGYLMLHAMLKREGLVINRKRTYRIYSLLGMQVRTKQRKKLIRPRIPMALPTRPNERWSLDFVHDQLGNGRRIRVLNIVDDYSRACVGQLVDTSISGVRVARYLDELAEKRAMPKGIVLDNGPELTSKAMFFWSQRTRIKLNFIQPAKPTQNAFVESFNGRFRDGCLNQHWFKSLDEARRIIKGWRHHYNHDRPHSSLGYRSPIEGELQAA
jgi:putative transposase